jgi:sec-independent protein translocase protein TatA
MGLGNLSFGEILVILAVVLLLFGAKRIPEVMRSFGKGVNEFKRGLKDMENDIQKGPDNKNSDKKDQ